MVGAARSGGPSLDLVELTLVRGGQSVTSKRIPLSLTMAKLEKVTEKLLARLGREDDGNRGLVVILGGARYDARELFDGVDGVDGVDGPRRLTVAEVLARRGVA